MPTQPPTNSQTLHRPIVFKTAAEVLSDVRLEQALAITAFIDTPCQSTERALRHSEEALQQAIRFAANNQT